MKNLFRISLFVFIFAACLQVPASLFAQTTVVTGQVLDPGGIPYAFGTVKAQLTNPAATVTLTSVQGCAQGGFGSSPCQVPIQGTVGPSPLDGSGNLNMTLYSNTSISPGGTQWIFTVAISPGIAPPLGTGPQSFQATITITGATQNIGATLQAAAPALTNITLGNIGGLIQNTQVAVGTAPNTIGSDGNLIWAASLTDPPRKQFTTQGSLGVLRPYNYTNALNSTWSIDFSGHQANAATASFGDIQQTVIANANGAVSGQFDIHTTNAGVSVDALQISKEGNITGARAGTFQILNNDCIVGSVFTIAACVTQTQSSLGRIIIPGGVTATIAATLDLHGLSNVIIIGAAQAPAATNSTILFTGAAGPIINMSGCFQCRISGVQFNWNNAAFTGDGISFDPAGGSGDEIDHVIFTPTGAGPPLINCINGNNVDSSHFHHNWYRNCAVGLLGSKTAADNFTANEIGPGDVFSGGAPGAGTIATSMIRNLTSGSIHGDSFEMVVTPGGASPSVLSWTIATVSQGVSFTGNWIGDTPANYNANMIDVTAGDPEGWVFSGNTIVSNIAASGSLFNFATASFGVVIEGNELCGPILVTSNANSTGLFVHANNICSGGATGLNITGGSLNGLEWSGNSGAPATYLSGVPASGYLADGSNVFTYYGSYATPALNGANFTGITVPLSSVRAATANSNTIANGNNYGQTWNWALTSNQQAMKFGETSAATGGTLGTQNLFQIATLPGSTATPLFLFNSLTGSQQLPALYVAPTWNTSGVLDGAIRVSVTNTASGAGSKLLSLLAGAGGATPEFSVDTSGNIAAAGNINATATTQAQNNNSAQIATTAYTDLAVANGIAGSNPAVAVLAASTASLTGTYSNGASGIGATFTVTATGAFTLDGIAINTIGQRVLLKNQASAFQNGVYGATIVGSVGISPVFTRVLDYDMPSDINSTGAIPVQSGTANTTTSWLLTSTVNTVGTDALTYIEFSYNPVGTLSPASVLASGIVDGTVPITITTGTTATLGAASYKSGYTFNQEATAGTGVTYTLPATAVGLQYCVANSIVSGTGAPDTGILTVYPPASSFVILRGVINTIGGGGTHGVVSGGAAGDAACFVAIDATHWTVYPQSGSWTAN